MGVIQSISNFFTNIVHKYLPDPLVFALLLTGLVFGLGVWLTPTTPIGMLMMWGDGYWNLLAFTMQMALILVTGHALASTEAVKKFMRSVASVAKTPGQAVMLVTFVAAVACIINWGFGLIAGAMFAREVARKMPKADYSLLIAAVYIGFLTWHGGLSGSVPLSAATPGNPMEKTVGLIPLTETLLTGYNLFITLALVITLPLLTRMMLKPEDQIVPVDPELLKEDPSVQKILGPNATVAERMEESKILGFLFGVAVFAYLGYKFYTKGVTVDINTVNMAFVGLGVLLHKTPLAYARAVSNAVRGTAGIIVQFPLYAGIQMMMDHSGLGGIITNWFIDIANADNFAVMTFFSSGLVNFAVPSGGGHWVVQGPFVMPAAQALGADMGKAAMAIAYGEAWMNMAQPFWALPALAVAGLSVRHIMGYCITALLFSMFIFIIGLQFFS